ncbi:putative chitin deacetylase [Diaporthe ampelina]|uniref:Putative chitin deacetylase n=1 Tax=Diaporthe ampelina TaxID=1214573 RepID=A0A0G2FHQ6_9PEZI|nr:putative chitin deacetylase [Diaporthe ampelina]
MNSFTSALLPALPALAGVQASPSVQNQPVAFDNVTSVPLLAKGDACGYAASPTGGSICGNGLCCSSETNVCGSGELSCSAISCLPKYSTGCAWQGSINDKLQPQAPSPGRGSPSSLQKRQDTARQGTDSSSSSSDELYQRPSLPWLAHLPRPELGSVPYGELITTCNEPDTVALTFDDGPWQYTEDLLDILRDYDAEATFFVCGGNMGGDGQITDYGHPHLLRRMADEGHQVGTHTWAHADLTTVDEHGIIDQLLLNEQAIVQALDRIPTYFRPPYFSTNDDVLDAVGQLGYHVVNAGVDTNDWKGDYDAARQAFSQAVQQGPWDGSGGKIVLAHDIHDRTVHELAAYMIEQARDAGFRLVTLGECMGDPEQNWYRNPRTGGPWASYDSGSSGSSKLVARDEIPPAGEQGKGPAGPLRSYHPPTSTAHLHKVPLKAGHAPPLLPIPTATEKSKNLVTRAAEPSESHATGPASQALGTRDAASQPDTSSFPSRLATVPGARPTTGGGSRCSKAIFGLVMVMVNMLFLLQ